MKTIGLISGQDLETDKDGFFEISVDSAAARGRKNHIQTKKDSSFRPKRSYQRYD